MKPCIFCFKIKKPMKTMEYRIHSSLYRGPWMREVGTRCNIILKVPVCASCRRIWFLRQAFVYLIVVGSMAFAFYLAIYHPAVFPLGFMLACLSIIGPIWHMRLKRQRIVSWLCSYEPVAWKIEKAPF